jgi:hypothetical protein
MLPGSGTLGRQHAPNSRSKAAKLRRLRSIMVENDGGAGRFVRASDNGRVEAGQSWVAFDPDKQSGSRFIEILFFVAPGNREHVWQCLEPTCGVTVAFLNKEARMQAIVERCCGLDVHQDTVVACLLIVAVGTLAGMRQQQFRKGVGQTGGRARAAGRGRKLRRGSYAVRHLANTRAAIFSLPQPHAPIPDRS